MAIPSQNRVGSYQLVSLIRAGHSCEIWKVRKGDQETPLAMKLLPRGPNHVREQVGYLKHEYAVGRSLENERIIRLFDFGSSAEGTYLLMELFAVPNLKQRINLGVDRLAFRAAKIIRQAALGLLYVHDQGWVHCDIKPDNFLVSDGGDVKIIDFSLSQKLKGRLGRLISGRSKIQGTKSYMSPEQIRGTAVDERSDIYALGCVIHELIGGKLPFTGTSSNELLTKHLRSKPPSLQSINKNVETSFSELVVRTMAKQPSRRPESMQALLDELDNTPIFRRRPLPPAEDSSGQDPS